jgi:hypothetical protein
MKTSKILLMADKSNNEETPKKVRAGQLLKSILVIFMLSWMILLTSCVAFIPVRGHEGHSEQRGHSERHDRGGRHH